MLTSLYKMWPDFSLEETGFEQLYRLFRYATELDPEDVVVVDAMTFSENPVGVLSAYCEHLEIPFRTDALSWQAREVRRWKLSGRPVWFRRSSRSWTSEEAKVYRRVPAGALR